MFSFDLQRFGGGKGGVTYQTAEYQPTVYELRLQELQVGFVEKIMPNAESLNAYAGNLLENSIAINPISIGDHLETALGRYEDAYTNLYASAEWLLNYFGELDNRDADFEQANADYLAGFLEPWDSTFSISTPKNFK